MSSNLDLFILPIVLPFVITSILILQDEMEMDVEAYLRRRYEGQISDIEIVEKEDLDMV